MKNQKLGDVYCFEDLPFGALYCVYNAQFEYGLKVKSGELPFVIEFCPKELDFPVVREPYQNPDTRYLHLSRARIQPSQLLSDWKSPLESRPQPGEYLVGNPHCIAAAYGTTSWELMLFDLKTGQHVESRTELFARVSKWKIWERSHDAEQELLSFPYI